MWFLKEKRQGNLRRDPPFRGSALVRLKHLRAPCEARAGCAACFGPDGCAGRLRCRRIDVGSVARLAGSGPGPHGPHGFRRSFLPLARAKGKPKKEGHQIRFSNLAKAGSRPKATGKKGRAAFEKPC